jgi:iron(III) transport system permease protein
LSTPTIARTEAPIGGAWSRLANAWKLDGSATITAILVCVFGFMVLYPIGTVIGMSFKPGGLDSVWSMAAWGRAWSEPGLVTSIINTLKVVAVTQSIALPVAVTIAWFLARTDVPFGRALEFGFWILFFLPALGVTTGWLLFFDSSYGLVNKWLIDLGIVKTAPFDMYSFWGIVFAHLTTYGVAVKVMLLTPAFRNLDGALEEASRVCGASGLRTILRVVVPVLTPAIVVVMLMSIIRGLESFEIELFLGTPINFAVYTTKIYRFMSQDPPRYANAAVLATSILAMMLPLLIAQRWAATRRSYAVLTGRSTQSKTELGRWRWVVFGALLFIVLFMSILPLSLLVMGSFMKLFGFFNLPEVWTVKHWRVAIGDDVFLTSLKNMLTLGAGTAICAVVFYSIVSYCTVRLKNRFNAPLDVVTWLPLTIPGIILSFGYLYMSLRVPVFTPFYGTMAILILVSFLGAMTLGVQIIKVHMLQIGNEVEEAGRVVGGSWTRTYLSIITPLAAPALAIVGVMVFAGTIRQVSSIILLSTGDTRVLALLQIEYLVEGVLGPASVVGTIIVMISLLAAICVRLISQRFGIAARSG